MNCSSKQRVPLKLYTTRLAKKVVKGFISDSCNVMRSLRSRLIENDVVDFSYGCAAHPINNLVEDLLKLDPFKVALKQAMFLSKSIKYQGLLSKVFAAVCKRSLDKALVMVLFSPSRWSSVNYMFQRLRMVMRPMMEMPMAVMMDKAELRIDASFVLPPAVSDIMGSTQSWEQVELSAKVFDPMCKCRGVLESDSATCSTA
jgi:hypothetical protein